MTHELSQQKKSPTEKEQELHAQKASAVRDNMFEKEASLTLGSSFAWASSSELEGQGRGKEPRSDSKAKAKATAKPSTKRRAGAGTSGKNSVLVQAATLKGRTAKDFKTAEAALQKATEDATETLEEAVTFLGRDAADADFTVKALRARLRLGALALGTSVAGLGLASMKSQDRLLFAAALHDPYLRDLQTTLLTESVCRCLPSLYYVRDVQLNLLPHADALDAVADERANGISLVRKIAQCVQEDADAWRSNSAALKKVPSLCHRRLCAEVSFRSPV